MDTDPQAKLVILGNPDVGKSSILQRYVSGAYTEARENTVGAKFMGKRVSYQGKHLKLNIWDTAGQERYQSFSKIYCRDAQVVILVYDHSSPDSLVGMKNWYEAMKHEVLPPDAIFFIAGNKCDRNKFSEELDLQVKEFGDTINAEFFNVSAKTGEGIGELFSRIIIRLIEKNRNLNKKSVILDSRKHTKSKEKKKHKWC